MTLTELKLIEEILLWTKGVANMRAVSGPLMQRIHQANEIIEREIKVKEMDPRKTDISGNMMNGD
jgi:hypothetical protein